MDDTALNAGIEDVQKEIGGYLAKVDAKGEGMMPPEMMPYWEGHRPRFDLQLRWFIRHLWNLDEPYVLDVGTGFPFATSYFAMRRGGWVIYGCPVADMPAPVPRTQYQSMNLAKPWAAPYVHRFDLVVCTECLEHLSCNLYTARNRLMDRVNEGGYLLLSFPLGGARASDYDAEWPDRFDTISHAHVREFTRETMKAFVTSIGWRTVAEEVVRTRAYGGEIGHVLLRRED